MRHYGKELMKIEKKIGPGDEPSGTLEVTGRNSDTSSLQTTACVRPDIYECTYLIALDENLIFLHSVKRAS